MDDQKSPKSAEKRETLRSRILNRLAVMLLTRFLRLTGWGAVVGLPAMILGPRRFAGIARKYPIASATICIAGLLGVALWNESSHSGPIEIESIDQFDEPIELLAMKPPLVGDQSIGDQFDAQTPLADAVSAPVPLLAPGELHRPVVATRTEELPVDAGVFDATPTKTETQGETGVVWLTGDIEDFSSGEASYPVRSAVRFTPRRR